MLSKAIGVKTDVCSPPWYCCNDDSRPVERPATSGGSLNKKAAPARENLYMSNMYIDWVVSLPHTSTSFGCHGSGAVPSRPVHTSVDAALVF